MVRKSFSRLFRTPVDKDLSSRESIWRAVGPINGHTVYDWGVVFGCEHGQAVLRWLTHDLIHVCFKFGSHDAQPPSLNPELKTEWPNPPTILTDDGSFFTVRSAELTCLVNKNPFTIQFDTLDHRPLCSFLRGIELSPDEEARLCLHLHDDESGYGLGYFASTLDMRGKLFTISASGSTSGDWTVGSRFYVGLHRDGCYGVYWESPELASVDIGASQSDELRFGFGAGDISFFVCAGSNMKSILSGFTELIGRIKIPLVTIFDQRDATGTDQPVKPSLHQASDEQIERSSGAADGRERPDWSTIDKLVTMALNIGLSASGMDTLPALPEQGNQNADFYVRLVQAVCLLPLKLDHILSAGFLWKHTAALEPHGTIAGQFINLRYQLSPFLYSLMALCHEYGWPMIQPLFSQEPQNVSLRSVHDCFLLGDSVLVAPALKDGITRRDVYLPQGVWYDFWTERRVVGQQTLSAFAGLERLPIYVRAGSVLPMWHDVGAARGGTVPELTYHVYPGQAETVLYEDNGESTAFANGDYRWIYVSCDWDGSVLMLKRRTAGRFVPNNAVIHLRIVGLPGEPSRVRIDRQGAPIWFVDGDVLELTVTDKFQQIEVRF